MEIKTCEEYVLRELQNAQEECFAIRKVLLEERLSYEQLLGKYNKLRAVMQYVVDKTKCDPDRSDCRCLWVSGFFLDEGEMGQQFLKWLKAGEVD